MRWKFKLVSRLEDRAYGYLNHHKRVDMKLQSVADWQVLFSRKFETERRIVL